MTLAEQIKALPAIKDETGSECVSREVVLALVAASEKEENYSIRCIGYPDCDGNLVGEAHTEECLASQAAAERQMKRGSGT